MPKEFQIEIDDASDPRSVLDGLEEAVRDLLDAEESKLTAEVEFLREVYAGISGGSEIEAVSSEMTAEYLQSLVNSYFGASDGG